MFQLLQCVDQNLSDILLTRWFRHGARRVKTDCANYFGRKQIRDHQSNALNLYTYLSPDQLPPIRTGLWAKPSIAQTGTLPDLRDQGPAISQVRHAYPVWSEFAQSLENPGQQALGNTKALDALEATVQDEKEVGSFDVQPRNLSPSGSKKQGLQISTSTASSLSGYTHMARSPIRD